MDQRLAFCRRAAPMPDRRTPPSLQVWVPTRGKIGRVSYPPHPEFISHRTAMDLVHNRVIHPLTWASSGRADNPRDPGQLPKLER